MSLQWEEIAESLLNDLMTDHDIPPREGWEAIRNMAESNLETLEDQ
jgi:hypothetical protein